MSDELLSLSAAERHLWGRDWRGRHLRKEVAGYELAHGVAVFDWTVGKRPRVSLRTLERHLPQLFPDRLKAQSTTLDRMERNMRRCLEQIDESIALKVANEVAAQVDPRIEELQKRITDFEMRITSTFEQLGERVAILARF